MNIIFDYFKDKPIKSIYDICNEFTLYNLLLSIEPNLKKLELKSGSDYDIKYNNFTQIIESISNYLMLSPECINFTSNADFRSQLKIDGIIKCQKDQAILLSEMILFISSISSNKESYEKLDQCRNQSLSLFISIQEKYSKKYDDEKSSDSNHNITDNEENDLNNGSYNEKQNLENILLIDKLKKEVKDKNKIILQLQSNYDELEAKYNTCNQELTHLKDITDTEFSAKEDLINQEILNNSLKNELKELKITKDNLVNEYKSEIKTLNTKLAISSEKITSLLQEREKNKKLTEENEKLKEKIKELNSYKEKDKKLMEYEKIINGKNDLIQELTKEKDVIYDKNISLMKELSELKQEINNKENKKMSVENELRKVQDENKELKQSEKHLNMILNNKRSSKGFELTEALLEDGEIDSEEEKEDYKQKYLEAVEEMETYKNIILPLTEEKEKLENENKEQKEIIQKLGGNALLEQLNNNSKDNNNNSEGDNTGLNKDKEINSLKQKISEQNNVSEELRKILDNKVKESDEYKKNALEKTEQLETYKNAVTLLTEEKGEYMNECQQLKENIKKLEYELSQYKNNSTIDMSNSNLTNINTNYIDNSKEVKELKEKIAERDGLIETLQGIISGDKDISVLKTDGIDYKEKYNKMKEEKEEIEKKLNELKNEKNTLEKNSVVNEEKNKKLEEEINDYKNNNLKLSNDNNKLNKEINELKNKIINDKDNKAIQKKIEELNIENEKIKNNAIKEHELISSSIFELAIQFFNMKNEIKEIKSRENNNNEGLSWIEIERRKNFPCEYYN